MCTHRLYEVTTTFEPTTSRLYTIKKPQHARPFDVSEAISVASATKVHDVHQ